jgi:hypothetical protein
MKLTTEHQQVIRSALKKESGAAIVTDEERRAIRQICADLSSPRQPEKLLIAFKCALDDAATNERVPVSVERNVRVDQLVTVFIEELYAPRNGASDSAARRAD